MTCNCSIHTDQNHCDKMKKLTSEMFKPFPLEIAEQFRRNRLENNIRVEAERYAGYDKYCTIKELEIILDRLEVLNKDKVYQVYELIKS